MMNSRHFNIQRYECYLSIFGRKVLGNLVKNFIERNECNKLQVRGRNNYDNGQIKRVLNFGDSYIPPTREPNVCVNESHNNGFEKQSTLTAPQDAELSVMSSKGLLKTATENEITAEEDASIALKNASGNHFGTVLPVTDEFSNRTISNNVSEVKDHIEWDDIFDTQLLNDLNILDTNSNISAQKEIIEGSDACAVYVNDLCINKKDSKTTKSLDRNMLHHPTADGADLKTNDFICNDINITSTTSENLVIKKGKIKRTSANKTANVIPKTVKIPHNKLPKNTFRKQKYAKAVKTWLQNVEPEKKENDMELQGDWDNVEGKMIQESSKQETQKNIKKTVQAQLRNKGGIMKFGKPKQNELAEKPKLIDSTNTNTVNSAGSITVKEKKAKPKFVAPVKSQIPVKDICYDIINLNDDSCKEHVTELSVVNDQEVNMILTFSNGFCQLNSHYTEDTYLANGVIFEINNVIYYWKNVYKTFCNTLEKLMNNNTIVCYAGKNLLKYFIAQCNIHIVSTEVKVLDLQIGGSLIDPNNPPDSFTSLQKLLSFVPEYTVATECARQKCAWYLAVQRELFGKLRAALTDYQLWNVFVEIEMPVLPIIAEMEVGGVCVDTARLHAMGGTLERRLRAVERACHAAAPHAFQINSSLQVRTILYDELRLDVKGNVRVRETLAKGDKSTSENMLRSLMAVHPLPRLILEYRHIHKAHATFVAGITNQVKDGVIKPTWEQMAAVTGRIACNNPNLQAIPKAPFSLVLFPNETIEEELLTEPNETLNFRSVYIPRAGHVLLAADFQHIECRVFAVAAADTGLLAALASPDLFRVLAARWLGKAEAAVSCADRERTKRLVYASLYGAGARRLADILGLGYDAALAVQASFNRTFPSLKSFGRSVVSRCERAGGRLATLCGRSRTFPNMFSGDPALRAQAERQAVNFIVQGSAADLCKLALVAATRRVRGERGGRLLLQLHDELVWEVPEHDLPLIAAEIKSVMEGIGGSCGVAVPLPVAVCAGRHWGAMEPYPQYPPPPPPLDTDS